MFLKKTTFPMKRRLTKRLSRVILKSNIIDVFGSKSMKKEKLTADHIRQDLIWQIPLYRPRILPILFIILGIVAGIAFVVLEVSLSGETLNYPLVIGMVSVIGVCVVAMIYLSVKNQLRNRKQKKEFANTIDRGNYHISIERLTSVERRTAINQTYRSQGRSGLCEVTVYSFSHDISWTDWRTRMHYEWSRDYHLTPQGLENISVAGNYFYVVFLRDNPNISYVYPCKFFESDECPDYFSE